MNYLFNINKYNINKFICTYLDKELYYPKYQSKLNVVKYDV